jgi:hypothetical protein
MMIILAFVVGIIFGIFLEWSAWTRCRRQHTKVGTPSASHNSAMDAIALCYRIAAYNRDTSVSSLSWGEIVTEAKRIVQQHQ